MDVIKPKLIKSKNPVNMEVMMNQSPGVNIVDGQANIRGGRVELQHWIKSSCYD